MQSESAVAPGWRKWVCRNALLPILVWIHRAMPERKSILHRTFLQLLDIVALELLVLCLIEASVILLYHNNSISFFSGSLPDSFTVHRNSLIILGKRVAVIYALIRSVVALIRLVFFVLSFFISSGSVCCCSDMLDLTKAFIVILCGTAYAFWKQAYSDWMYLFPLFSM